MDHDSSTPSLYVAKTGLRSGDTVVVGTDPRLIAEAVGADRRRRRLATVALITVAALLLAMLLVPGLLLWLPSKGDADSRANLGASLLGGAVVAFSVLAVEILSARRMHQIETVNVLRSERAALQLQLSLRDDFAGLDVSGRDLSNFYLRRKNLSDARLVGTQLEAADLSYAVMPRANLAGAHMDYAHLRGTDLADGTLSGAQGWSADLTDANLEGAELKGAQLPLSTLAGANLRNADLRGANLNSCDLSNADLRGALLEGALLSTLLSDDGATWPDEFNPDEHGVTRIDRGWAQLILARHQSRYEVTHGSDGRILKLEVLE